MPHQNTTASDFLTISITFAPPRICVGFRSSVQASQYLAYIKRTHFHDEEGLQGEQDAKDRRLVSIRLPGRAVEMTASKQYNGFYITFSDESLARQWNQNLLIWDFVQGSRRKLYLRCAVEIYNVGRMMLSRCNWIPKSRQLSDLEEQTIIQFILDLDSRGFPLRLRGMEEMANRLLAKHDAPPVGKRRVTGRDKFSLTKPTQLSRDQISQASRRGSDRT
ncbi:hypothetical protein S40288_11759 [Stachybotrys chartarum IBT 40288]|nr:hypothetical protein S40288_11759 [Stachybotrys chartarum IBT 40288]